MKIDFKKRTINGKPYECLPRSDVTLDECLERIEELYRDYKFSMPTEKDKRKTYFYALPVDKMTDAELVLGKSRERTREALELYVLDSICSGILVWDNKRMGGNWFYKGKDKDLVILREWIEL